MQSYLNLLKELLTIGEEKEDRTNTGTLSIFGRQQRYNLQEGFPILTTKKIYFSGIVAELLWFLKGDTNIHYLHQNKCTIWNEWANEKGNLGPIYWKTMEKLGREKRKLRPNKKNFSSN